MKQQAFRDFLRENLDNLQAKNPAYSLRAFAKKLKSSPSTISDILRGKRNVSNAQAKKIINLLSADIWRKESLIALFDKKPKFHELTESEGKFLFKFPNFAILALFHTKNFKNDSTWIAKKLNIKNEEVEKSIRQLIKLGLLEYTSHNKEQLVLVDHAIKIPDQIRQLVSQNEIFRVSKLTQNSTEISRRSSFVSIIFAMDPNQLDKFENLLRTFLIELALKGGSTQQKEIYHVGAQIVPLSN